MHSTASLLLLLPSLSAALTLPGRWRLSFNLPNYNAVVTASFVDADGYEPPKGRVLFAEPDGSQRDVGRWVLSEDPDDRRDGLWIWGLFEDPLYPFCIVTLASEAIGLPEGGRLVARLGHKSRPDDDAPLLTKGTVYQRKQAKVDADLFGLAQATFDQDTPIGTIVPALLGDGPEDETPANDDVAVTQ
mmetsp:Transcript_8020/g.24778  ORF Transcript_8020/g.24778 Transcript_8020/m.24778 type:complete len:188 (-) Transcript_8020:690-1253(-)